MNNLPANLKWLEKFITWECTKHNGLYTINHSFDCDAENCEQTFWRSKEFFELLCKMILVLSIIELVVVIIFFMILQKGFKDKDYLIQEMEKVMKEKESLVQTNESLVQQDQEKQDIIKKMQEEKPITQPEIADCLQWNIRISKVALNARSSPIRSNEVKEIQRHLKELGFFTYPEITDKLGGETARAINKYQISCQEKLQ